MINNMNLDLYLFNLINGFGKRWAWLDFLVIFFAKYLSYALIVVLFFAAYFYQSMEMFLLPILVGFFSRFVLNEIVYLFYIRKRPSEVISAKTLIKKPKYPSFPSGHASFFFGFSFTVMSYNIPLGIVLFIFSILISLARVFSGVHWPSDILAGLVAGLLSAFLFFLIK